MFIWAGDYLTNILSYFIVYRWIFRMPFRKNKPFCIGVVCTGALLIIGTKLSGLFEKDNVPVTILALLSILLLIEGNHMIALFRFPIAFFGAGVVNVLGSYFLAFLFQVPYGIFMRTKAWVLLAECFFPVVFFILFFVVQGTSQRGRHGAVQHSAVLVSVGGFPLHVYHCWHFPRGGSRGNTVFRLDPTVWHLYGERGDRV